MNKMHTETTVALIQKLETTIIPDINELKAAFLYLYHAAEINLTHLIKMLSEVLVAGGNSQVSRMAAGLHLKNHLTSKDPALKAQYQQRWLALPQDIRLYIKKNILSAIGTETSRPSSAAQCVAYVAVAELPVGQWNDLIPILVENVCNVQSTELKKEATLEAIGYICQDIDAEVLTEQSDPIFTAIIHGMRSTETSNHVRLAATQALLNSLEFAKAIYSKEKQRNYIMEVVCEAAQSTDMRISVAALQCLVKMFTLYYQFMDPYMKQALLPITLEAIHSDVDEIALQGIEFWSNIINEEMHLYIEEAECSELGLWPKRTSRSYAKRALQHLVPELMRKLTKQHDFDDKLDWNPSKAASVCLKLLSDCCEDEIVPHVLPFINSNIKNENWRYREAALMAFGSILGGLKARRSTLKPLVEKAMPPLIEAMYHSSVAVRGTAAWTFGQICEIVPEAAMNENYLKPLLQSVLKVIPEDLPKMSDTIMTALLTMFAGDAGKAGCVQKEALMAVSTLVEVLRDGFLKYMDAFKGYLYMGLKNHQKIEVIDSAVALTGDIIRALKTKVVPYCDEIMLLLIENLCDPSSIHCLAKAQILSVIGDIALTIGPDFAKYFDVIMPILLQASNAQLSPNDYDMVVYLVYLTNKLRESVLEAYTGIIQGLKGASGEVLAAVALVEPHVPAIVNFMIKVACEPERTEGQMSLIAGLTRDLSEVFGLRVMPYLETRPILDLLHGAAVAHAEHQDPRELGHQGDP